MIRKVAFVVVAASVVGFGASFVQVLAGRGGAWGAALMISIVAFIVGIFATQFSGQGLTRAEGPKTFAAVDAAPAATARELDGDEPAAPKTWTRTWLSIYFWTALGEFYLGLLFVIGGLVSGRSNDVEGGLGMGALMWIIAAPFFFFAFRTAAKDRLHQTGLEGRATIRGVRQTGAWVNNNPVTVLDVEIKVDGHPAYEVRHRESVPQVAIGRLTNGETLPVRVNPNKPSDFIIEWEGA